MANTSLKHLLQEAERGGYAIGHFNFATSEVLRAIIEGAASVRLPVIVGTSEGERKFIGLKQAVKLVEAFREEFDIPIFLNADHTKSVQEAKNAVDAGYDAVLIDASSYPFDENVSMTKQVVEYAKSKNPDIIVEGELGYLPGESKIQPERIEMRPEQYTDPQQAEELVRVTGIDLLAPAIGNIHGITLGEPRLDIERLRKIKKGIGNTGLVLHAGSGIDEAQIQGAIREGIAVVHINTDIRVAFADGLKFTFERNPTETTPYRFYTPAVEMVKKIVEEKMMMFSKK